MSEPLFPPDYFRALERIARRAPRVGFGSRPVARRGLSVRGYERRPYRVGDAPGDVDWRSSARSGRLQIREREAEHGGELWLWMDRSASLAPDSESRDRAQLRLALAQAWLALESGARVRLMAGGDGPWFAGFERRAAVQAYLEALPVPGGEAESPPALMPGQGAALSVLADPWLAGEIWQGFLAAAPRFRAADAALLVLDSEDDPPRDLLELEDVESGGRLEVDLRADRGGYLRAWREQLDGLTAWLASRGMRGRTLRCPGPDRPAAALLHRAEGCGAL